MCEVEVKGVTAKEIKTIKKKTSTVKPWVVTCLVSVLQDEQIFLLNFNLINESYIEYKY